MRKVGTKLLIILLPIIVIVGCLIYIKPMASFSETAKKNYKDNNSTVMRIVDVDQTDASDNLNSHNSWTTSDNPYYTYTGKQVYYYAQYATDADYQAAKAVVESAVYDNTSVLTRNQVNSHDDYWDDSRRRVVFSFTASQEGTCRLVIRNKNTQEIIEQMYIRVVNLIPDTIYVHDLTNDTFTSNPGSVIAEIGHEVELMAFLTNMQQGVVPSATSGSGSGFWSDAGASTSYININDDNEFLRTASNTKWFVRIKLNVATTGSYTIKLAKQGSSQAGGLIVYVVQYLPHSISFVANGGSEVAVQNYDAGATTAAPTAPTREGYSFDGWYTDEELTSAFTWGTILTDDYTLYAKWTELDPYEYIEGDEQTYTVGDDTADFRIDADYSLFATGGAVYVDDVLVDPSNYTSESGSTIIKLKKTFMDTLGIGTHTMKVVFNNSRIATTTFTIANATPAAPSTTEETTTDNPNTQDPFNKYIMILLISLIGIEGSLIYMNKDKLKALIIKK